MSTGKPPADAVTCTHRGCTTKPTRRIQGANDRRPWYGCAKHAPAMEHAFHVGQSQNYEVANEPIGRGGQQ